MNKLPRLSSARSTLLRDNDATIRLHVVGDASCVGCIVVRSGALVFAASHPLGMVAFYAQLRSALQRRDLEAQA